MINIHAATLTLTDKGVHRISLYKYNGNTETHTCTITVGIGWVLLASAFSGYIKFAYCSSAKGLQ